MTDFGEEERHRLRRSFEMFTEREAGATPLYACLSRAIAENRHVLDLFADVEPEKRKPVVLFAAVHYLILGGTFHELGAVYEASEVKRSLDRAPAVFADFCEEYEDDILELMQGRTIQTNEVNRMTAFLPALMYVHRQARRPLALIELGASAGLNLLFDRYRYDYANGPAIGLPGASVRLHSTIRSGRPHFDVAAPPVDYRVGVDLKPVDLRDEDALRWLRACVFAGDVARDLRLRAAADLSQREWVDVHQGDAIALLPELLQEVPPHAELCLFNSWMMGWMAADDRERLTELVTACGARRTIWWLTYEQANKVPGLAPPADVDVRESLLGLQRCTSNGVESQVLARVHPHGVWLDWLGEPSF